jgi:tRNA(fMet)-specific endonuclease VapC
VYVLDTDTCSYYLGRSTRYPALLRRIREADERDLALTVVTVEERLRLALDGIRAAERKPEVTLRYAFFLEVFRALSLFQILPYDEAAAQVYQSFAPEVKRVGTRDCRIAAICIAGGHTVVTHNTRDFARIPGVRYVDWTAPE